MFLSPCGAESRLWHAIHIPTSNACASPTGLLAARMWQNSLAAAAASRHFHTKPVGAWLRKPERHGCCFVHLYYD